MTVLPQGERELLEAHERLNRRRTRLLVGPPSGINGRGHTSRPSERGPHGRRAENRRRVPRITPGMVALVASVAVVFGVAAVFLLGVRKPHAPAHASLSGAGQHVGENGIDQDVDSQLQDPPQTGSTVGSATAGARANRHAEGAAQRRLETDKP